YRAPSPVTKGVHTVAKGETMFSIAWRYHRNYKELARSNGIRYPYSIFPGQRIRLAVKPVTKQRKTNKSLKKITQHKKKRYKKPETKIKPVQEKVANQRHKRVNIVWTWPASGSVITKFSSRGNVNKGIDLAGRRGAPVYAAASGKVVYSGQGLVGYGNLIIIKHNDSYLSAYAHNQKLLVKEGHYAKAGQKIAEIGSSGANRNKLHFEIRRNGKPVNPLAYLPKR
ncbi:MAG: peptidoglycan DD-metalloendopeptidase family protein, partial [Pseudomonadales bacterium]|nr:peptidoglycan DD-metalloendopeptidase family protein [Pseudomonadales bacterium]